MAVLFCTSRKKTVYKIKFSFKNNMKEAVKYV